MLVVHGGCLSAPAGASATSAPAWQPRVAAAVAYARTRHGATPFAAPPDHRFWGYRAGRVVVAAGVPNAILLVAYRDLASVRDWSLTAADRAALVPMIRRCDNDAATTRRGIVRDGRLVALAPRVGMRSFAPNAIWGLSQTTTDDQSRFFLRVDAYLTSRHRLRDVAAASVFPGTGGGSAVSGSLAGRCSSRLLGAGTGAVDHQVALLEHGRSRVSIAIMTIGGGTHRSGTDTPVGVTSRLLRGLPRYAA